MGRQVERRYSEEDIERGLTAMAVLGSSTAASDETGIPSSTLREWRNKDHADRYQELRARLLPRIQAKLAADSEDLAIRYAQLEHEAIEKLKPKLDDLRPAELAGTVRNLATSRAISVDKSLVLHGQPTHIVETRSTTEVLDSLKRRIPAMFIDSDAEEIDGDVALTVESRQANTHTST